MRIVSGEKRGLKLNDVPPTVTCRPTIDRVKEAIFDIIRFELEGKVLDLFSGTGQLGLEALSNGCEEAVFCDNNEHSIDLIKRNVKKAGYENRSKVLNCDYKHFLKHVAKPKEFKIILLDPPFGSILADKSLNYISQQDCLADDGIIVLECDKTENHDERIGNLKLRKKYTYGKVAVLIYIKEETNNE